MCNIIRDNFIIHNVEDNIGEVIMEVGASASFYLSIVLVIAALAVMTITIAIYGSKKWRKCGLGRTLQKLSVGLLEGAALCIIFPIIYIILESLIYRSLIENIYIVITRIFW